MRKSHGAALAIVMLFLTIMLIMIYSLNQVVLSQQKSINNYSDNLSAQNYAKLALFQAESTAYYFDRGQFSQAGIALANDSNWNLALPIQPSCQPSCPQRSLAARRYAALKKIAGYFDLSAQGTNCNSANVFHGFCYKVVQPSSGNYASEQSWQPWQQQSLNGGGQPLAPCASYNNGLGSTPVLALDDRSSRFSISYPTGDQSLCTQPRFMLEPLNVDFYANELSGNPLLPSARLYRITVRAFGRNGTTHVTLQEYVAISDHLIPLAQSWLR